MRYKKKILYIGYSCVASTDSQVFVIGGRPKTLPDHDSWKTYVLDVVQIYNITTDIWSYGSSIPAIGIKQNGLESAPCSVDAKGKNIYVFGGRDDFTNSTKNIYKYNIAKL